MRIHVIQAIDLDLFIVIKLKLKLIQSAKRNFLLFFVHYESTGNHNFLKCLLTSKISLPLRRRNWQLGVWRSFSFLSSASVSFF